MNRFYFFNYYSRFPKKYENNGDQDIITDSTEVPHEFLFLSNEIKNLSTDHNDEVIYILGNDTFFIKEYGKFLDDLLQMSDLIRHNDYPSCICVVERSLYGINLMDKSGFDKHIRSHIYIFNKPAIKVLKGKISTLDSYIYGEKFVPVSNKLSNREQTAHQERKRRALSCEYVISNIIFNNMNVYPHYLSKKIQMKRFLNGIFK